MAPKVKITREMIENAAFEVIRMEGHESLNARTVAKKLNCSTQPVLYSFKTVDEIREAAYRIADEYHTTYIMPQQNGEDAMLEMGMNYVRFGHEEKNLFRFLFQTDKFGGMNVQQLFSSPDLQGVMEVMAEGLGKSTEEARKMFMTFFCGAHGMASLLANNAMEYDENECRTMLENVYYGMMGGIENA